MMEIKRKFYEIIDELVIQNPNLFKINSENKISSILLFKDFNYRLLLWKNELNKEYERFGRKINFDNQTLLNDISVDWKNVVPNTLEFEDYIKTNFNYEKVSRVVNYIYMYMYICWEVFKNTDKIKKINLPNPYEGLVKIFVRDNIFISEGVFISNITLDQNKSINLQLPSIGNDFLDYIDSKCKLVGGHGIPNQEEINKLWEEFQSTAQSHPSVL